MCLVYGIQFLDSEPHTGQVEELADNRSELVLSYAAVMGMIEDIGMTGSQYSWLAGIFYFGSPLPDRDLTLLIVNRIPRLGISHQQTNAEATSRKVHGLLYRYVGRRSVLARWHL